jgi:hypothetical protein
MLAERLAVVGGTLTREHDSDRFVVAASAATGRKRRANAGQLAIGG